MGMVFDCICIAFPAKESYPSIGGSAFGACSLTISTKSYVKT